MPAATMIPEPSELSDTVLVEAIRRHDEGASQALIRRHSPLMLGVARRYLGSPELAEDIVQDTWIAVLRGIDRFEGRSAFKTWLLRILANTALKRRVQEARSVCWSSAAGDAEPWDAVLPGGPASPEHQVLAGEVSSILQEALDALPQRQRSVLVLRDVVGWSSDEVRDVLRISPGNERVLLHRARTRMRSDTVPCTSASVISWKSPAPAPEVR